MVPKHVTTLHFLTAVAPLPPAPPPTQPALCSSTGAGKPCLSLHSPHHGTCAFPGSHPPTKEASIARLCNNETQKHGQHTHTHPTPPHPTPHYANAHTHTHTHTTPTPTTTPHHNTHTQHMYIYIYIYMHIHGRGSKNRSKMEPWKVETWTKTCVTPPVYF